MWVFICVQDAYSSAPLFPDSVQIYRVTSIDSTYGDPN